MKTLKLFSLAILLCAVSCKSQVNITDIINQASNVVGSGNNLTNDEIVAGLKEALTVGTNNSTANASKINGYFGNPKIKIPFPPEAKKIEQQVRKLGMNKQVDDFVLTLNRAAEEAAKEAAPIFINAIKNLTIQDAMGILKGADDAATQYLKKNTSADLKTKFKPVVKKALQTVRITKYWNPIMTAYNKIPLHEPINPNLEEYVTQKAIDGLFVLIAEEELKIRKDPLARITDLLKKVFGGG